MFAGNIWQWPSTGSPFTIPRGSTNTFPRMSTNTIPLASTNTNTCSCSLSIVLVSLSNVSSVFPKAIPNRVYSIHVHRYKCEHCNKHWYCQHQSSHNFTVMLLLLPRITISEYQTSDCPHSNTIFTGCFFNWAWILWVEIQTLFWM